jgi:glycosyltransferase involved in cell wall biosynthesis
MSSYHFADTSLLITVYNRPDSLERQLKAWIQYGVSFGEIIVSDDCSPSPNGEKIKEMADVYGFKLITTPVNKGLGNNLNKGQKAVSLPLTLYVQEDFVPDETIGNILTNAHEILDERPDFDMVRFYAYFEYPYMKPLREGFSEMDFNPWYSGTKKFYFYSDHPHLRRSNFLQKFGKYQEGIKSDATEYRMMINYLQRKGKAAYYNNHWGAFEQKNSSDEPSTINTRVAWRMSNHIFIAFLRSVHQYIKFYKDYWFSNFYVPADE